MLFPKKNVRWGVVGPTWTPDGVTPPTGRQDNSGASVVTAGWGEYDEMVRRGWVWSAQEQSGVAPGATLSTTAAFSLYNPAGSGKVLSIQFVTVGYISGTLGAGTMFHCVNAATATGAVAAIAAPTSGTLLNIYNRAFGIYPTPAGSNTPVGVPRSGSTVTAPVAIEAFCSLGASLATTAVQPWRIFDAVNGRIRIFPGSCYQLQSIAAAGSTPLVAPGVCWAEIPII
jgi:hypothetical protein